MGFTADLGYECWFPTCLAKSVEAMIDKARAELDFDLLGYGLGALEVCRLEGGLLLLGGTLQQSLTQIQNLNAPPMKLG